MRVNGSWDIYSQRVGGRNATPIVNDPQRNERGVGVFAGRIARSRFTNRPRQAASSSRARPAKSVRRVTDNGFDPAWSPDGKQIAFATEEINDPAARYGDSTHLGRRRGRRHAAKGRRGRRGAAVLVAVRRAPGLLAERRRATRHLHGGGGWRRAGARDHRCRRGLVAGLVARRPLHLLLERPWQRR